MTAMPADGGLVEGQAIPTAHSGDRRNSPIPTVGMVTAKIMELRRRRGLMIAVIAMDLGFPALFLLIRLILHVFAPRTNPPAGGDLIFVIMTTGFLPTFSFITAVLVGGTAGSRDVTEGMFRHLVVTGRSRLALYLARIPAGLAILLPVIAISYTVICAVSAFAAPAFVDDWNVNVPPGLSQAGFEHWAANHARPVICFLASGHIQVVAGCSDPPSVNKSAITPSQPASPRLEAAAVKIASRNYRGYTSIIVGPSISLMTKAGLWIELEATVAFVIALGLAALMGQRTGPVLLLLVLQLIVTPILGGVVIPHLQDLQRSFVGLALARLKPAGLPTGAALPGITGGVGGPGRAHSLLPGSVAMASWVIIAWLAAWTIIGAWRMTTRDA
jgi:hypothetical protein